jgi:hypothetical protein
MLKRDPERLERLRIAVRYLLTNDKLAHGYQARLAQHFSVTRQRVNQVVSEEETRTGALRRKRQLQLAANSAMAGSGALTEGRVTFGGKVKKSVDGGSAGLLR